jgi:hypothetical protein
MHVSRNPGASSFSFAALYPMVFAAAICTPGTVSFPTPQSLTVEYLGKTYDKVSPSVDPAVALKPDGTMDGVFRFTLPSVQTITAVELQGNGAWNVNGGWVPGVSATPGSALLNAANGTVNATGSTFTIYAADGGTDRFLPDAVMTITVVTAAGTVRGSMTIDNTPQSATLTLNPAQRLQTFQGWEGGILSSVEDYDGITPAKWGDIFELAVAEGYTRMRLSIRSGVEGSGKGYEVDNDNRNPNVINPAGFNWSIFDRELDIAVLFRQKSLAAGKRPYISLNYVDFGGVSTAQTNPAEYAEFLLAVFQHMQTRNGFVPEGVEASLEPDTTNHWTPAALGRAIVAAKARLNAAGFSPEFIAPSVANMRAGASFIDGMLAVPGAAAAIAEFSYHRYGGGDPELNGIVQRAIQHGKRTSMLEYWGDFKTANSGAGYRTLAQDLTRGRNSAWQQGVFADNYGCISQIIRLVNGVPELCPNTRLTRQYTKYIGPGDQRIGVTSASAVFSESVAFVKPGGRYVVVVKADGGSGNVSVGGLPAGTYTLSYATHSTWNISLPDVTIAAGQNLNTSIPGEGALTIVGKSGAK